MIGVGFFDLDRRHLEVERVTYRRMQTLLREELLIWLSTHKVEYSFSVTGRGTGVIHIHDPRRATLFKLTWM